MVVSQLRAYSQVGGTILFGTDVGYMDDYDPTEEYVLMARAGMSFRQILTSLTTAPAERFGASARAGRIAPGFDADITLLEGDPATDVRAFSRVKFSLSSGKFILPPTPQLNVRRVAQEVKGMRRLLLIGGIALLNCGCWISSSAAQQALEGDWVGAMKVGEKQTPINTHFKTVGNGLEGSIDYPLKVQMNLILSKVS